MHPVALQPGIQYPQGRPSLPRYAWIPGCCIALRTVPFVSPFPRQRPLPNLYAALSCARTTRPFRVASKLRANLALFPSFQLAEAG